MYNSLTIAVLITSHNRREKTLECLRNLFSSEKIEEFNFDVFLVDDGSVDGTSEAIREQYPKVNIIKGNGELYWNQGMRLAWKTAMNHENYDFYMWLNDDTMIDQDALEHIFSCYNESLLLTEKPNIIVGACRNNVTSNDFSYGVRDDNGPIIPNGEFQTGKYINGNCVLISKDIVKSVGILSKFYTHAMGDYDYGLCVLRNEFNIVSTKKFVATCPNNIDIPIWCNQSANFIDRWRHFHSPLGLNIREYMFFVRKNFPNQSFQYIIKAYAKCLMPSVYNKLSNYAK
tara:strand:- start:143 stop:1003 length:861 start_codon:yes stop_codon:yes gene_type:complete